MLIVVLGVALGGAEPEPPVPGPLSPPPLGLPEPPPEVGGCTNDRLTSRAALTITEHVVDVPEHAPPQLLKTQPDAGEAVSVTKAPGSYEPVHVGGHETSPLFAVTEPVPVSEVIESR